MFTAYCICLDPVLQNMIFIRLSGHLSGIWTKNDKQKLFRSSVKLHGLDVKVVFP